MFIFLIYVLTDLVFLLKIGWVFMLFYLIYIYIPFRGGVVRYYFSFDDFSSILILLRVFIRGLMSLVLIGDYKLPLVSGRVLTLFILFFLILVFGTRDLAIFYFSFEFIVVPIFLMVLFVGGIFERLQSGYYLFLYTLVSSMPFLLFVIYVV